MSADEHDTRDLAAASFGRPTDEQPTTEEQPKNNEQAEDDAPTEDEAVELTDEQAELARRYGLTAEAALRVRGESGPRGARTPNGWLR